MYSFLRMFLDEEQALLIILLLLSVPISYLLGRLRSKYLILGVSITFSFIFQSMMYGAEKYILWVQQQIVYLILRFAPRHKVGRYVIIETFLNLAAIQIRRMYISYGVNKLDITGILMMQTFLYVGLAYNYQNGIKPDHQLSPGAQARRVKELPDYLTYIGYCFFLPACLVGPVFEFRDYEDYLNQKGDYENIPNTLKAGLKELGIFLTTLGIYVATMSWNLWYTISPQFAQSSYAYKIWYILATIFNMEFKYITAWSLGMISIHCSGLSYNKQNNSFDKIQVTKIMGYFLDPSLKVKTESWNMSIQMALKRYIYEQDYNPMAVYESEKAKKRAQNIAQRNTMLISALWHGFYPGYFISFFHWIFYLRMNQDLFRLRRANPKLDRLWTTYRFGYIENLLSNFVLSYFGIYIHLMTFQSSKRVIMATYGIPFVILYGLYFVVNQADLLTKLSKRPKKEPAEVISGPGKSRDE